MDSANEILIKLLRSELCQINPRELICAEEITWSDTALLGSLYMLSAKHDLVHVVGSALDKLGMPKGNPYAEIYKKAQIAAVYRYEQLNYELKRLCSLFDKHKMPFIPLKGSNIRKYYPYPEMRTSCDIDILIEQENVEAATELVINQLKYKKIKAGSHDVNLISENGINLELHFTLIEANNYPKLEYILSKAWGYAVPDENSPYRFEFTPEFAYFYHIAHMVKHFEYGGCGIRTLMDLWIFRHRYPEIDEKTARELLDEGMIGVFEDKMRILSEIWFSAAALPDEDAALYNKMEAFILEGGIYGSTKNRVQLNRAENQSNIRYIGSRLVVPYEHIKYDYPVLQKHKALLPFCEIHRWFRLFSGGTAKRILGELKISGSVTREEQTGVKDMLVRLGLKQKIQE